MSHLRQHSTFRLMFCVLLAIVFSFQVLAGAPDKQVQEDQLVPDLFYDSNGRASSLDERQADFLARVQVKPTTRDINMVDVRFKLLENVQIMAFNLFHGKRVVLQRDRIETRATGDYSWFGNSGDGQADAILVVKGDEIVGNVRWDGELYSIRPLGNGLHVVIWVDQQGFPDELPPLEEEGNQRIPYQRPVRQMPDRSSEEPILDSASTYSHTINVLVGYTSSAKSEAGNIDNLIQLAIDETNQSYSNSDVNPRLALVHKYQVSYTENTDIGDDLSDWRNSSDSYMNEVHTKRNEYGADVAILLVKDNATACGVAYVYPGESSSFGVVSQGCATGNYSLGHEIGHIQGAHHNPEEYSGTWPFAYGHGYYNNSWPFNFRTIMSYNCPGGCTRIQYWSNPNKTKTELLFWTSPMGTASTSHNARVLNETAAKVSAFRTLAASGSNNIFTQAPGHTYNHAIAKVYIPSSVYNSISSVTLSGQGHNQDCVGYARVMEVKVNSTTYRVITWINSGSTVAFSGYSIPKSALNSGLNTIEAYIHFGNDTYDCGHWVTVNLNL